MYLTCRNTAASGCQCPEHAEGLKAYARNQDRYQRALDTLKGRDATTLTVITTEQLPTLELVCDGTMTCPCRGCSKARLNPRPRDRRQPWDPRPGRIAA